MLMIVRANEPVQCSSGFIIVFSFLMSESMIHYVAFFTTCIKVHAEIKLTNLALGFITLTVH